MWRLAATLVSLALLAVAGPAAGAGGQPPQIPRVPGTWTHIEMNVTIKHVPHTIILDRGRILQVTTTQLTVREGAGVNQVIPVTAQTLVTVDGARASIFDLRRRMSVITMRIDGGDAVRVRASSV
jgi:hypothetical protein